MGLIGLMSFSRRSTPVVNDHSVVAVEYGEVEGGAAWIARGMLT